MIYAVDKGKLVRVGEPRAKGGVGTDGTPFTAEERRNFLIVCQYGDWSGFLSLAQAVQRLENELEKTIRPDGFFWIAERL
jgi:hypothetical protein